jgi:hypothetical protein
MLYSRRTHKVEIRGKPHEVTVYRDSKWVWIATGRYMDETLEVKGQSAGSAIELWKDAATSKGNPSSPLRKP